MLRLGFLFLVIWLTTGKEGGARRENETRARGGQDFPARLSHLCTHANGKASGCWCGTGSNRERRVIPKRGEWALIAFRVRKIIHLFLQKTKDRSALTVKYGRVWEPGRSLWFYPCDLFTILTEVFSVSLNLANDLKMTENRVHLSNIKFHWPPPPPKD